MSVRFTVRFNAPLDLSVDVAADDNAAAESLALVVVETYLQTIRGISNGVRALASADGLEAYEIVELGPDA